MSMVVRSVVVALVMASTVASADDAVPVAKLLAEPDQLAAWLGDRDPMIESQRAKIAAASAAARQTRVIPNPTLNVGVSDFVIGHTNNSSTTPSTPALGLGQTLIYTAGIDQLIEIGKRGPRQNAADTRRREASETAVGTLGSRLSDAMQNLGKLAYVAAKRTVVATNLEAANKLMESERKRVELKDLSPLEFARIELDTEEIELQLTRADADLTTAIATCSATLFASCTAAGLDAQALDAAAPLPDTLTDPASAIESRPARVASKLEGDALGWDARLAHNRRIPDPTIGVGYTLDNLTVSGDQHQSLLFSVGIPLPLFDRGDHDEAAARATARSRRSRPGRGADRSTRRARSDARKAGARRGSEIGADHPADQDRVRSQGRPSRGSAARRARASRSAARGPRDPLRSVHRSRSAAPAARAR
jgi:cobalt-zinc-cadmium efflux system outer membrane protein